MLPADGYVSWIGNVPVLQDARVPRQADGPLRSASRARRTPASSTAGLRTLPASLLMPWMPWDGGAYDAFVAVNLAASGGGRRRRCTGSPGAAAGDAAVGLAASLLVATGNGMIFMVGMPQTYVPAYASLVLMPALAEWLGVWRGAAPRRRLAPALGWAGGVASTLYFTHMSLIVFWWVYGLRRVPWRYLLLATALAFGIGALWEAVGGTGSVGLRFRTDNSSLVGEADRRWLAQPAHVLAGAGRLRAARPRRRGHRPGAFPLAGGSGRRWGWRSASRTNREWALAGLLAGLVPTLAMLTLLALPRIAYFMYPAVYFLAAQGIVWLARAWRQAARIGRAAPAVARYSGLAAAVSALAGLPRPGGNADSLGYQPWQRPVPLRSEARPVSALSVAAWLGLAARGGPLAAGARAERRGDGGALVPWPWRGRPAPSPRRAWPRFWATAVLRAPAVAGRAGPRRSPGRACAPRPVAGRAGAGHVAQQSGRARSRSRRPCAGGPPSPPRRTPCATGCRYRRPGAPPGSGPGAGPRARPCSSAPRRPSPRRRSRPGAAGRPGAG